jgi:outer membrane protein OmpA-like peptidoglycan-associated protein
MESIEQARQAIAAVEREPLAAVVAPAELAYARDALASAERAFDEREPLAEIAHRAYVAQRHADISRERVGEARAREDIDRVEAERSRLIAAANEREAQAAARAAQEAEERALALETELEQLEGEHTDRGLVLTLGDVVFEPGTTTLSASSSTTIDRLAQFMRDYPERSVRIEGHTDSAGSETANLELSERRAAAVRAQLIARGLEAGRIETLGYGEERPIATNDTPRGRQENRRVEIVVSDERGSFGDENRRAQVR